jgi:archaellum component FlaC
MQVKDKLSDAISRLEGLEDSIDYISSMDVMDETPSEVSYQLEELGSDLSTLRMIIETLEEIKDNINGETNG